MSRGRNEQGRALVPIGFHASIEGGLWRAVERVADLGCDALQIFASNPRGFTQIPVCDADALRFRDARRTRGVKYVAVHTPYLMNLSSPEDAVFKRSLTLIEASVAAAARIGADSVVTHLGSHKGSGVDAALARVAEGLGAVAEAAAEGGVTVLLENSAGSGMTVGSDLAHIGRVLEACEALPGRFGLCFDTCHAFAAGYPMGTAAEAAALFKKIEAEVGLERLALIHLNDSKGAFGSMVDRHDGIGLGNIGEKAFGFFLKRPEAAARPIVLETPKESDKDDLRNLAVVRRLLGKRKGGQRTDA